MMLKGNSEPTDNGSHQTMRSDNELGDKEESKLEISMFSRRQMRVQTCEGLQKGVHISLRLGERDLVQMDKIALTCHHHSFAIVKVITTGFQEL